MSATVTDELIELRGLRFHYRDWPSTKPDAKDLDLLHGFTGHARSWDAFAEAMRDRYRILALDQRGHGESGWAAADKYGNDEMTDDLAAFVGALGLKDFALLGLSMGGIVAMNYAGRAPKALARLVIVDIGPEIVASGGARVRAANPRPPEAHHRQRINANLMRTEDGRFTWRYDRALRSPTNVRARQPDALWAACAAISVPTLIIRGAESDILAAETAQRMLEVIKGSKLTTVENSGHSVPLDAP